MDYSNSSGLDVAWRRCKVLIIVLYERCIIECNTLGALSNAVGST
jgi:hypothetical protein